MILKMLNKNIKRNIIFKIKAILILMNYSDGAFLLSTIEANCARPTYSSVQDLQAIFYLCLHLIGLVPHLLMLPVTAKLAKKRTAFSILLNINIMHILIMFWSTEIYVGYLVGHRIEVPFDVDAILYQICAMAIAVAYNLLAINRIVAIMAPILYCHIFTIRLTKVYVAFCWLCGLIYSLILNFKPHLRIFICISSLVSVYPPTIIKNEDDMHLKLINAISLINLISTSYTPTMLYAICLLWMVGKKMGKVFGHANAHHHHQQQQQLALHFTASTDNYSRERMRLYMICIVGTMPPFVLTVFTMVYYSANQTPLDPTFVAMFTMLYALFHIQQPLVMLLLSHELRMEMCAGFGKMWKKIRLPMNPMQQKKNIVNAKATKIAWDPS